MDPLPGVVLLAALFVGSHLGLASAPVRSRLVARFGEWGFRSIFFAVAAASFSALTIHYAAHRAEGAPGLALGTVPALRWLLVACVVAGTTVMVASVTTYPGSPYAVGTSDRPRSPRGLERITRHPFFAGLVLFGGAHALLATHRVGALLMLALAVLAAIGSRHQDAKLRRLRGPAFADYLAATSTVPFAAILAGRQRLVWRELPLPAMAVGLASAAGLRRVHDDLFSHGGAWVIAVVVGGALVLTIQSWRRERRRASAVTTPGSMPLGMRR
jgi:uncharacterized membrane protein